MNNKVTVLLPGGFKPPHAGHLGLVNKFAARSDVETVIVMVGPSERDGVNRQQSIAIWNLLPTNPKVKIMPVNDDSPMNAAFGYIFNLPKDSTDTVALGASAKSAEDAKRSKIFSAAVQRYKTKPTKDGATAPTGVNVIEMTDDAPSNYVGRTDGKNGQSISASTLRQDLGNGDYNNFQTNYPGIKTGVVKSIYGILTKKKPSMDESKKSKYKEIVKQMIQEDQSEFINALVGPDKDFETALDKINKRATLLTKTAQDAASKTMPK
jgi:hypothetical protein